LLKILFKRMTAILFFWKQLEKTLYPSYSLTFSNVKTFWIFFAGIHNWIRKHLSRTKNEFIRSLNQNCHFNKLCDKNKFFFKIFQFLSKWTIQKLRQGCFEMHSSSRWHFFRKLTFFASFSDTELNYFSIWHKFFRRVVKTAFYVSWVKVWLKVFFHYEQICIGVLAEIFPHSFQDCYLSV